MPEVQHASLEVNGGRLHYAIWGDSGPLVLASHGLTANHVSFVCLARALGPGFRLIAPDHRGRGRSRDIQGPWGMEEHARDMLALMDALHLPAVDLMLGHSMGGFVAAVTGAMAPERIGQILMVDGGLPVVDELPAGMTVEALVESIVGPSVQRLDMRFESVRAYRDFWREQPAFAEAWSSDLEDYLDYDLIGAAPDLRPSGRKEAIYGDVQTQLLGPTIPDALRALPMPVRLLTAERGVMNGPPLYPEDVIDRWASQMNSFSRGRVADVNHLSIVLSERGGQALAGEIRELLGEA